MGTGCRRSVNNKINTFIEGLFNLRLKYKNEKNPLQGTIKLLLNSIYGKSILKPIDVEIKSIPNYQLPRYIVRNYNYIHSMEGNRFRTYVKVYKPINRHFNLPQFGASVLSWSKYLMNRVITTAEQNGLEIYYQDTDSMHILESDIDKLAVIFSEKYGQNLIGSKLTQFHCDFDSIATDEQLKNFTGKYHVWSKKLIALGKKSYLDILEDNIGNTGYHIRLKGIPNKCILNYCSKNKISVEELYMKLYNGETITFNILDGSQGFKKTSTFEQTNRKEFTRNIKF